MARRQMVGYRCTETERAALEMMARAEDRTSSEMLRELVRQAARERGLWPGKVQQTQQEATQ